MSLNKYKILIIPILLIFILFILYIISNSCGMQRIINSTKVLGLISTVEDCKIVVSKKIKNKFDLLLLSKKGKIIKEKYLNNDVSYIHFPKKLVEIRQNNVLAKSKKNSKNLSIKGEINNLEVFLIEKNRENINLEWLRSHGGNHNLKYSDNDEINLNNFNKIKLLWKFKPKKFKTKNWKYNVEVNPIFFNNNLYVITANNKIYSLDALNGKEQWSIESVAPFSRRGLVIDKISDNKGYLYLPAGNKIYKIDSETGKMDKRFGKKGYIKFNISKKNSNLKTLTAPVIYGDNLCYSLLVHISCVDKITGEKEFDILIHPKKKDFKYGGIIWGGIALDDSKGLLYVVTGNPRKALIGYNRIGENKNANSIIAIDLNQKKIVWEFQDVSHDLWDYDLAHPPIIHDLNYKNKIYPSVISVGKTGNIHIINRYTGNHLFDVNYKQAPSSNIPGEKTSDFQIFMQKPERLLEIEKIREKIIESNSTNKGFLLKKLSEHDYGWFQPPNFGKKLITLGLHGGASWTGSSINIHDDILFTPINLSSFQTKIEARTHSEKVKGLNKSFLKLYKNNCSSCHGKFRNGSFKAKKIGEKLINYVPGLIGHSIFLNSTEYSNFFNYEKIKKKHKGKFINKKDYQKIIELFQKWDSNVLNNDNLYLYSHWSKYLDDTGMELLPAPYGKVFATDLKSGKIIWSKDVGINSNQTLGSIINGGVASNKGDILIVTGTPDQYVYLLSQKTGEILWKYKMESAGSAPPIFFEVNGKQFFSIISTGGLFTEYKKKGSTLYTFAIN